MKTELGKAIGEALRPEPNDNNSLWCERCGGMWTNHNTEAHDLLAGITTKRTDSDLLNWLNNFGYENGCVEKVWSLELPEDQTGNTRDIRAAINAEMDKIIKP